MGAYENPLQAIDKESGMIIANAIAGVGQTTANAINKYYDSKNKEIKEAAEKLEREKAEQNLKRDQLIGNLEKSNVKAPSWYAMTDNAINEKFRLEGLLDDAPDESRYENGEIVEYGKADLTRLIDAEKQKIRLSILAAQDIERWKAADGKRLDTSSTNDPGGIFTGSDASEFSKKINLNYRRKQAIVGTLIEDGKPANVEYEFKEVGGIYQIFGRINGGEAFNVMDTLNQDYVEIENIVKGEDGIDQIWKDSGMQNPGNKKFVDSYLGKLKVVPVYDKDGKLKGEDWIRPVNMEAVVRNIIPMYEQKFMGMVEAVDNEDDYNDLVATYLEYVPSGKPLETVMDGSFKLTEEAKIKFVKDMVGFSLEKRIPSYEYITAERNEDGSVTFINNANQRETLQEGEYDTFTTDSGITYRGEKMVGKDQKVNTYKASEQSKPSTNTWAVDNYNSFITNPSDYLKGEPYFPEFNRDKDIITIDRTDDEGNVTGTEVFDTKEPHDIKALFLLIDNTTAGRKRADQVYNIAKQVKAERLKNQKQEKSDGEKQETTQKKEIKQSNVRFQQQQNKKLESQYEERAGNYYLKEDLNKSKGVITNLTKYKKQDVDGKVSFEALQKFINPRQGEKSYPQLMKQIRLPGGSYPRAIKEMPGGFTKENIENYLATKNKPNADELWDKHLEAFENQDKYEQTQEGFEQYLKSIGLDTELNPLSKDKARPTNKVK